MRAIRCTEYGEPEGLVLEDLPAPSPKAGQVVVDVKAASVNYPDALIVANKYQAPAKVPFTPGSDFAGVVSTVGDEVTDLAPGDRVFGTIFVGAFAEQVVSKARNLTKLPDAVDFDAASAFTTVYQTAYDAVRSTAAIEPGQTLVVLGAAGGVGSAAVQVGKLLGARVIACASSPEKLALTRELGADETLDYTDAGWKAALKELAPKGVDAVIDPVGGPYSEVALRATGYGGRFVVVGFAAGDIPRIPLNLLLLKGSIMRGYSLYPFSKQEPEACARNRRELLDLLATGKLRPHVTAVRPLAEVPAALRSVLDRKATGKIVIHPGD